MQDNGGTANTGVDTSATTTLNITLTAGAPPVHHNPVTGNNTVSTLEDAAKIFSLNDFPFADNESPNPADGFKAVIIDTLPSAGRWHPDQRRRRRRRGQHGPGRRHHVRQLAVHPGPQQFRLGQLHLPRPRHGRCDGHSSAPSATLSVNVTSVFRRLDGGRNDVVQAAVGASLTLVTLTDIVALGANEMSAVPPVSWTRKVKLAEAELLGAGMNRELPDVMSATWTVLPAATAMPPLVRVPAAAEGSVSMMTALKPSAGLGLSLSAKGSR